MDILLLGGPRFLGHATIDAALTAGHKVTLFNRGRTNPDLYPQVKRLYGDRNGQLEALKGHAWDVVIDTCGYIPRVVRQSAELLSPSVGRYIFISSISVYKDPLTPGAAEDAPLAQLDDPTIEVVTGEAYGGLKALCEQVVQAVFADKALIVRPGLIVGPHDPTHRFTYWVTRTAAGGEILAPGESGYPEQVIDVRDLAEWMISLAELGASGVYNATGPDYQLTLGRMLETCREVARAHAQFVWVSEEFLLKNDAAPWSEIPLWIPGDTAWSQVSIEHALADGLAFRPLADTIYDTLVWALSQPAPDPPPAGLSRARETELLAAWWARQGQRMEE